MKPFAPSAATASDATTTSGLGSGLGSALVVVNKKVAVAISNSFYVVFYLSFVHIPNFIQTGQKT